MYEKEKGISIVKLSENEILDAAIERLKRYELTWKDTNESNARQSLFWEKFMADPDLPTIHPVIHPKSRIGDGWLTRLSDLGTDKA